MYSIEDLPYITHYEEGDDEGWQMEFQKGFERFPLSNAVIVVYDYYEVGENGSNEGYLKEVIMWAMEEAYDFYMFYKDDMENCISALENYLDNRSKENLLELERMLQLTYIRNW